MFALYWTKYKKPYLETSCLFIIHDANISFCLPNLRKYIFTVVIPNNILKDLEIMSTSEDMPNAIKWPQYQQVQNTKEIDVMYFCRQLF
jgi:hypothetical protein